MAISHLTCLEFLLEALVIDLLFEAPIYTPEKLF